MSSIKAVIIEDEIPAARLLCSILKRIRPDWDIIILSGSIEESVEWFKNNKHPELIFLDIQLSDGNSFDFVSKAQPESTIIFVTAYDEYAIRAFSVNSIDYILKPVDEYRLLDTIIKYENILHKYQKVREDDYIPVVIDSLKQKDKRYRSRFLISGVDKLWTLQVNDVAYFYSENKITFAVTYTGDEFILDISLEKLAEQLDPDLFFRANRQILLCVDSIKRIEPHFNGKIVVMVNPIFKDKIYISKEKVSSFKMWLNY